MKTAEKMQPLLILFAALGGLLLGQTNLSGSAAALIAPFLMVMLYGVFLNIPLKHLGEAYKDFRFTTLSLAMNFIFTPLLAFALGAVFLRDSPELWIGLIMLMVTPCTDWYIVFTGVAGGNVPLATVQLPWILLLQLALLPFYLLVLAGALVQIETALLLQSVAWVLFVPLILAVVTRELVIRKKGETWFAGALLPVTAPGQTFFLCLAIAAMFASQGRVLLANPGLVLGLLPPVLLFFGINFVIGQLIGRVLKFSYENVVCFNFTTLARNSPLSLAIAVSAFPDRPLIALVLVIGPLIELPVLAMISQLLLFIRRRGLWPGRRPE